MIDTPRPLPWHFYSRGVYIGSVRDLLTEEAIRQMYPSARVYAIGHVVDLQSPDVDIAGLIDDRPASAYDDLGKRDPRD